MVLLHMDYEALLEKARKELPESVTEAERFEIPKVKGHLQGNKTIISNFPQICDTLSRPPAHVLKFILRELGAPGDMKGNQLVIGTKLAASRINEKIRKYATEFVLCRKCGKPDTTIVKEGSISYLKCSACGAQHHVKTL